MRDVDTLALCGFLEDLRPATSVYFASIVGCEQATRLESILHLGKTLEHISVCRVSLVSEISSMLYVGDCSCLHSGCSNATPQSTDVAKP